MFYVENYSPHMVTYLTLQPPNHVICLVNWELIASLLRRVSPERQIKFVRRSKNLTYEGEDIAAPVIPSSEPFFIIDTHFHLDLVVKRLRFRNFMHINTELSPTKSHGFYYGIANYVFPNNWSDWKTHIGHAKTVYVIFGIHPHVASRGLSSHRAQALQALLDENLCVAVGEIGLDYTPKCSCYTCKTPDQCRRRIRSYQEEVFIKLLLMGKTKGLQAIIHCKDALDGAAAARAWNSSPNWDVGL